MKKYLIKLADHLDKKGLRKEADYVDWIIKKRATEDEKVEDKETLELYPLLNGVYDLFEKYKFSMAKELAEKYRNLDSNKKASELFNLLNGYTSDKDLFKDKWCIILKGND